MASLLDPTLHPVDPSTLDHHTDTTSDHSPLQNVNYNNALPLSPSQEEDPILNLFNSTQHLAPLTPLDAQPHLLSHSPSTRTPSVHDSQYSTNDPALTLNPHSVNIPSNENEHSATGRPKRSATKRNLKQVLEDEEAELTETSQSEYEPEPYEASLDNVAEDEEEGENEDFQPRLATSAKRSPTFSKAKAKRSPVRFNHNYNTQPYKIPVGEFTQKNIEDAVSYILPNLPLSALRPPTRPPPQLKSDARMTSTGKPSHARKVPMGHIKRPRNAFILFRSHACTTNLVPQALGITDHRHISRIVGNLWKSLPQEEKKFWEDQAEMEKEEHRRQNPDYKYRPVYRREGVVRRRRRKLEENDIEEEERKCEVVARVLLEGGEIDEDRVEREMEIQRERDEIEGRVRGTQSRSPSRGESIYHMNPYYGHYQPGFNEYGHGPPHGEQYAEQAYRYGSVPETLHLQSDGHGRVTRNGGREWEQSYAVHANKRSRTLPIPSHHTLQMSENYSMEYPPEYVNGLQNAGEFFDHRRPHPLNIHTSATLQGLNLPPTTPRTLALQQHSLNLQQRIRGQHSSLNPLIPGDAMLVSPTGNSHPAPIGFNENFQELESVNNVNDPRFNRAFSADDVRRPSTGGPNGENWSNEGTNHVFDPHGDATPYSALGEMAAGSASGPNGTEGEGTGEFYQQMTFEPDSEVAYVFLDNKQAQDTALVDSIRAQGFGITFDIENIPKDDMIPPHSVMA